MSVPLAWLDGRLIPRDEARLAIHDAGFVFGATVTDFCRTFHQQLFRWTDHLARFRRDCSVCFIPLLPDDSELTAIARDLVANNAKLLAPDQELALISFATPGPIGFYAGAPEQDGPPTLCLHTAPLHLAGYRWFFEEGIALAVAGLHAAPADDLAPPSVKHRSRLHWWRGNAILRGGRSPLLSTPVQNPSPQPPPRSGEGEAVGRISNPSGCKEGRIGNPSYGGEGEQDSTLLPSPFRGGVLQTASSGRRLALLEDGTGHITETAIGNLLIVREGAVLSPPHGQVLDGISLRVVAELCEPLGIPFLRRPLKYEDCIGASEVILCGSGFCLAGVRWIDDHPIPWPGPITQRLLAAWSESVGIDIAGQILSAR
jgi:branched-subunit amino acid aminotransferase/4-amino-4-deoxychorismate lyase